MTDHPTPRYVRSADGTRIACYRYGSGRPVVVVSGALARADAGAPLAGALAEAGLQGVTYDRRGRGNSSDTTLYAPTREVEDLHAVIGAFDEPAVVFGHSSGAVLSWVATSQGVPAQHLFLSEPPLRFGHDEPAADLPDRLQSLVNQGKNEEAVLLFLRENVGLSEAALVELRTQEGFADLLMLAQTTVYDTRLVASASTPTAAMLALDIPTTIMRGDPAMPLLVAAVERLATAMPSARLVVVPESRDHRVDPQGVVRELCAAIL